MSKRGGSRRGPSARSGRWALFCWSVVAALMTRSCGFRRQPSARLAVAGVGAHRVGRGAWPIGIVPVAPRARRVGARSGRRSAPSQLGVGFRRQAVVADCIVDFIAPSRRLVVEVDGALSAPATASCGSPSSSCFAACPPLSPSCAPHSSRLPGGDRVVPIRDARPATSPR